MYWQGMWFGPRVWLARRLAGRGVSYDPMMLIAGRPKNEEKEEAIASVKRTARASILMRKVVNAIGKQ
jgi:hypothetical protein